MKENVSVEANSVTQDLVNRLVKQLVAVLNHNGSLKH